MITGRDGQYSDEIRKMKLKEFIKGSHDEIDLLSKLLAFKPEDRITAAEALNHPFVRLFKRRSSLENAGIPYFIFEDIGQELSVINAFT